MLGITFALAIGASLLAGLLPAWRACRIAPALQLKEN
jgi:putative ABC transport system permease protein